MNEHGEQQTKVSDDNFRIGVLHRLNSLRKANFRCDTIVRVEGQDFPVHSNVLSAASDYFQALFYSEFQVKEKQENLVELKVVKSSIMEDVLEFMYLGQVNISSSNAHDLLVASDYLIIPSLKSQAAQFLEKSMNVSNCFTLESFACQYNCDSLRQAAIKYKNDHFVATAKTEDFLVLEFDKVKELLCQDKLYVSEEEEVYEAAIAWVKHDLPSREYFLPDLLKCLRLFSMSKYSIQRILNKEDLVRKNPVCTAIMSYGLNYFLYPDQYPGRVLKHRTSIVDEEHVVLLIDGVENGGIPVRRDTYCFVLATQKWQQLSPIPYSCVDTDECAELVAAVCVGNVYMLSTDHSLVSCFNPQKNSWKPKETEWPDEIETDYTVTSFNEELYVIGGCSLEVLCTVFKYSPFRNKWKQLASMETGRAEHCAVVLEDLIYVIAGTDKQACLKSVQSYDPSTNQWKKVPDLAHARRLAAAATVCGKIVVVGGFCGMNHRSAAVEPTCEVFDPCLKQWSLLPSPNVPRAACGIVSVDDVMYLFGGYHGGVALDSVECYDAKYNEWQKVDTVMPVAKGCIWASLVKLPNKFISS